MTELAGRLRYLRNAEGVIAFVLPAVLALHWASGAPPVAWALRGCAATLVSFLLLQGALYWHLKFKSVAARHGLPHWFGSVFRVLRRINLVAFAALSLMLAVATAAGASLADLGWTSALFAFAVLEHVNYYHWQLMHDTGRELRATWLRKRLRPAALAVDLRRMRPVRPHGPPDRRPGSAAGTN